MGAVADRLDLTLSEAKTLLGITDTSRDALIDLMLRAAKEAADQYLNNPFVDADGVELNIPSLVKLGIIQWMQGEFDAPPEGAIYVKTGDISVRYKDGVEFSESTYRSWTPYRLHPKKTAGETTINWTLGHYRTGTSASSSEDI